MTLSLPITYLKPVSYPRYFAEAVNVKISDFPEITIPSAGTYHLVSAKLLSDLLAAANPQTDPSDSPEVRFGKLVRRYRTSIGETQPELAKRLNASEKTIRNLESGRRGQRHGKVIDNILEAFGEVLRQEAATLGYTTSSPQGI